MNCAQAKQWLLQAELPRELNDAPAEIAAHVRECGECKRLIERLGQLEREWREQSLPDRAAAARDEFLRRHEDGLARPSEAPARRRFALARLLVAAPLVVAAVVLVWLLPGPPKAQADSDVIEQLIDWNVQLSDSENPGERERLYSHRVDSLKAEVGKLPAEDRPFAESLIQNGEWLAANHEPLEAADRFTALADQLVDKMHTPAKLVDAKATARLAKQYEFISTRGIEPKVQRAKGAAADEAIQRKLEKIQAREAKRLEKLEKLHEAAPAATKKEIRKIIDQSKTKPKSKKNADKRPDA